MKSTFKQSHVLVMALLFIAFNACSTSDSDDNDLVLTPINSVVVGDYTVKLSSETELETGANALYWALEKAGKSVEMKSMTMMPMMDMGTMMHSSPYENPIKFEESDNYFKGMAVFIMPGGEMGSWSINFTIVTENQETIEGTLAIDVASSWKLTSVKDSAGDSYFISWVEPNDPVVGSNELTFLVHKRATMMSFPAFADAEVVIYPYMDMGGGQGHSTNFTAPSNKGNGVYEGDINYSMSGTWTTSVELVVANDTLPEVIFEYSVKAK